MKFAQLVLPAAAAGLAQASHDFRKFSCHDNGDGTYNVSAALNCDSTCDDCDIRTVHASPLCFEDDHFGVVEYLEVSCTGGALGDATIYYGDGLVAGLGDAGCEDSAFAQETVLLGDDECTEDDHDDHHDDDHDFRKFSCHDNGDGTYDVTVSLDCDSTCDDCGVTTEHASPLCFEDDHDGVVEYVAVSCTAAGLGDATIYHGDGLGAGLGNAGCVDEAFVQETVALVADECTQDEHDLEVVVADAGHLVCALAAAAALVAFVATIA
jgi:hypothetical protein